MTTHTCDQHWVEFEGIRFNCPVRPEGDSVQPAPPDHHSEPNIIVTEIGIDNNISVVPIVILK